MKRFGGGVEAPNLNGCIARPPTRGVVPTARL